MLRWSIGACLLLALCACDPLRDVERLEDVPLAEGATAATVAPPPSETADAPGFLSQLLGGGLDGGNALPQAAPSGPLPWGQVARACGVRGRALGTEVGEASGYTLYDTNPGTTALRTHYVTGFDDGCPRQVTAALAMFGDVGMHELVRYSSATPASLTDRAYETVRRTYCRVAQGQPCGSGLDRLARRTTFLTLYQRFGGSVSADILLHDGEVAASDFDG